MRRKQLPPATGFVLLTALLLAPSCSPDTPVEPAQVAGPVALSQGVVRSATGAGHYTVVVEGESYWRTFSFSALARPDGTVSGQFQLHAPQISLRIHGRVTCISVVDNAAWIGGVIEQSSDHGIVVPGTPGVWRVADNGEGAHAPPDQISGFQARPSPPFPPDGDLLYCQNMPALPPLIDIEAGNVRVRG